MTRRSNAAAESRGGAAVAAIDEEESRIKLFGRTIEPKMRAVNGGELHDEQILSADDQELSATPHQNRSEEEDAPMDELGSSSGSCEEDKPDGDARVVKMRTAAAEPVPVADINKKSSTANAGGAATEQQEKQMPRRPEKPVPCPRCNSMDTKFCYFNNYNVNQPRHFCKNCQRYWTAGGTLRNVPVGAGRRKSKHNPGGAWNSGHHHQEHLNNAVRAEGSTGSPQLNMNGNLKAQQQMKVPPGQAARMRLPPILPQEMCQFSGPETSPSGSSMITSLNSSPASMGSMFNMHLAATAAAASQAPAEGSANVSPVGKSGSSAKNTSDSGEANVGTADSRECPQHGNCRPEGNTSECTGGFSMFNGCPWPYNFPWNNVPAGTGTGTGGAQGNFENKQMDMAAWLSGVWAGMPAWAPFAAASLWGPAGAAAGWNMPWGAAAAAAAAAAFAAAATANGVTAAAAASPPFSKSLGKHARDKAEGGRVDGCLWAPKTLRIDDPGEAAKSSIWATLGLDKVPGPGSGGISGMYKAFQGKHSSEARSQVHANPAALSRSMSFHENN